MSSCRQARDAIIAVFRQQATEAESLHLELHLGVCQSCRAERAHWRLLEQLRDEAPQRLSTEARERVLQHITLRVPPKVEALEQKTRRFLPPFLLTATAVAVLVLAVRVWKKPTGAPIALSRNAGAVPTASQAAASLAGRQDREERGARQGREDGEDQMIRAQAPGTLKTLGARIAYGSGTSFRMMANARRVELYAGEVDVEVTPGGPSRFRVVAPRFIVEVIGTHFIVRPSGVETLHGTVRVLDANGRELAVLHAAEAWTVGDPNRLPLALVDAEPLSATAASIQQPAPAAHGTESLLSVTEHRQPEGSPKPSLKSRVDQLIAEARSGLAAGDPELARSRIAAALAARPTGRQRAVAGLLTAASFLVEGRYEDALADYRRTAESFDRYPESETAAFAIAQLLCERATTDEARTSLEAYLVRYPEGRFVQDARRKLASLP